MQQDYDGLRERRLEERIGWIVACCILFNCAMLLNAENLAGPIIIGLLEVALLAIMAKRMGVEEAYGLFTRGLQRWGGVIAGKED